MLLLRHGNQVLLQKRPNSAIWGGLWCLPESAWVAKPKARKIGVTPKLEDLIALTLPYEKASSLLTLCKQVECGENIKHIFTHRRLWIQIWNVQTSKAYAFASGDLKWVPMAKLGQYGLPQPIKLLLQGLSLARGDDLKN